MKSIRTLFTQYTGESTDTMLSIGKFRILDNPEFGASFLSFVANQTGRFPNFETWEQFLKTDNKPTKKPEKENPFLYQNPEYFGRDDLEARTYRAYVFSRKLEKWHEESQQAEKNENRKRKIKAKYNTDKAGYCQYIADRLPEIEKAFLEQPKPFTIPEASRRKHTYINGGTGSGKSEMMKAIIHHYLTNDQSTALVLIDPHGKIAQEVAQFSENANGERLVFISPDFDRTQTPVFNPFDIGRDSDALTIDIAAQELIGVFREIFQDVGFSPQMETLLKPCIATLLRYPKGNLYHLQQMMESEENAELLAFSQNHLPNPAQRNFLRTDFPKTAYAPSRQSIRTKIQSLLNSQIFLNFTVGESTFSLADSIAQRKLIIFSLSRNSGVETSDIMGRFIIASLQSIAMQRAKLSGEALENVPAIHLFIDECQHYIAPSIETILTETRKYKLYLTLSNQFLDQIESRRIRNAIKGNTALKITCRQTEPETMATIAKITGADPEELKNLETGQYHIKAGTLESIKIDGTSYLSDYRHKMTKEEWEKVKEQQIAKFYRKTTDGFNFLISNKKIKSRELN